MTVDASDPFVATTELLPGVTLTACNPLVHMNAAAAGDAAYARRLHYWFAARDVTQPPVRLAQYPARTCLDGETYRVLTQGVPDEARSSELEAAAWRNLVRRMEGALEVGAPCLLVCRTGEWCWGHWLLDMLPKIILAERCFPGRLLYAVPMGIVDRANRPAHAPEYARSVLGSLAAYGIGPARLLGIRHDTAYRFASLFISHDLPAVRQGDARAALTAVLRALPSMRPLANGGEIRAGLDRAGAGYLDPLQADFIDQVAAFARSDVVVGDLGSNLAGMIYARPGTGLVSLGPLGWDDDYFAKLFQRLDVAVADVRGVSAAGDPGRVSAAPYYVPPGAVTGGLDALRASEAGAGWRVGDRMVARLPGPVVFQLRFSADGNAFGCDLRGFSAAEEGGTWSVGAGCSLVMPLPEYLDAGVWLEVQGVGFVSPPRLVSRPFGVRINGVDLLDLVIDDETVFHVHVPLEVLCLATTLEIFFRHPCGLSPRALGLSDDARELGFLFRSVSLRTLSSARR